MFHEISHLAHLAHFGERKREKELNWHTRNNLYQIYTTNILYIIYTFVCVCYKFTSNPTSRTNNIYNKKDNDPPPRHFGV